jgi:hypothetical protein
MKTARNRDDNIATRGKDARTPRALPQVLRSTEVLVRRNEKPELRSRFELRVVSIRGFFLNYFASHSRHNEASYNSSQQDSLFLKFILVNSSICFGQTYSSISIWPADSQHNQYDKYQLL